MVQFNASDYLRRTASNPLGGPASGGEECPSSRPWTGDARPRVSVASDIDGVVRSVAMGTLAVGDDAA